MPDTILSFPTLQVISINDFTPGVFSGADNSTQVFSTEAPLGSASQAFRCYARPKVGLRPFPAYTTGFTFTFASGTGRGIVIMGDMRVGGFNPFGSEIWVNYMAGGQSLTGSTYMVDVYFDNGSGTFLNPVPTPYNHLQTSLPLPLPGNSLPLLTRTFTVQSALTTAGIISLDPSASGSPFAAPAGWVAVPNPTVTGGNFLTGTVGGTNNIANAGNIKTTFVGERIIFFGSVPISVAPNTASFQFPFDSFYTSNIQATTGITGPEFFLPESGCIIGSWGSISSGEWLFIYQNGGGGLVYGDLAQPSQIVPLPGLTGTGQSIGEAVPTPIGLVYTSDYDGAWVWNGSNVSQKLSSPVPDNQLTRIPEIAAIRAASTSLINIQSVGTSKIGLWTNWVMFPNNWFYDCLNNSWWQSEDPAVNTFNVNAGGATGGQFFYSSPGHAFVTSGGGTLSLPIMRWDHNTGASSYKWTSNPLPIPGADVEIGAVEICASNTSSTSCTVQVIPTGPPGTTPFPNQNPNQSAIFTIPPTTASFRQAKSLGWNDYNVCVQVIATNSNASNAAPTLHELNLGCMARNS